MSIELTTLGGIRVVLNGEEADDLMRQKLRLALLIHLSVERETSREGVAGMFWRDRDPDRARHSLSQALYGLRGTLGDGWLNVQGDRMTVTRAIRVDATEFEAAAERGDIGQALDRYHGPFLDRFACGIHDFDHWADRKRASLRRQHRRLRKETVDDCLASGKLADALTHARTWAGMDPMDDEAQHRFIELLAASGERASALRQYEIYRTALAADDLTPLDDTEELVSRVRAGDRIQFGGSALPKRDEGLAPAEPAGAEASTLVWGGADVAGPRLVRVVEGGREGEAYPLEHELRIGRDQGDLRFPHDTLMSSRHASIRMVMRDGEPVFMLKDEGSRNGVFVRIHGERPLRHGDVFAAGKQVFEFNRSKDEPAASDEPPGPGAATRLGLPKDFV